MAQYINHSGWMTLPRPPFNANGADFYSFGFVADHSVLQRYLDKTYNVIAGRQRFRPLLDMVFLAYVKNAAIIATTPPFSNQGGMPEIDVGFWLLVGSYDEGAIFPTKVACVPAYLFVDSGFAVAVGREIMGYPKYVSDFTVPPTSPWSGFSASAMLIKTFAPDAIASQQQFLSLRGTNVVAEPLYIKQFRSADGSDTALYQSLLEGPLTLRTLRNMGLLAGEWTLEAGAFDSLPFVTELGLGTPKDGKVTLTTKFGIWASMDYESGTAVPLV